MKKIFKAIISVFISLSLVQSLEIDNKKDVDAQTRSSGEVTLAGGTADEFVVGADNAGKVEDAISSDYTQASSKKPVLSKGELTAISFPVGNSTQAIYPMDDGTYIAIIQVTNYETYVQDGKPRIETIYVAKIDKNGTILDSKNVPKNSPIGEALINENDYTWNYKMQAAYRGSAQYSGNEVTIMYDGQMPGADSNNSNVREYPRFARVDSNLNITFQALDFTGFSTQNFILRPSQVGADLFYTGFRMTNNNVSNTLDVFRFDRSTGKATDKYSLVAPGYDVSFPSFPSGGDYWKQELMEVRKDASGNFVGKVITTNHDSTSKRVMIVGWDASGQIKYIVKAQDSVRDVLIQSQISDENSIYYLEDNNFDSTKLQKLDTATGNVVTVATYPTGTDIDIFPSEDTVYGTTYKFNGSITTPEGQFNGYASKGGAVTGSLNSDFSVYNASVIEAEGEVKMYTVQQVGTTDDYVVGGLTNDLDYTNAPENGWPNQETSSSKNLGSAYFGSMKLVEDYAPAIKFDGKTVVNKDTLSTEEQWDSALTEKVLVNDTYELSDSGNGHTMEWLRARINRNPNDLNASIEWSTLGLNKSVVGYNQVKYFVSDSSRQVSALSTGVNVIDNNTTTNSTDTVAIKADNFSIKRTDVGTLTDELAKTNANVYGWDMNDGSDLTSSVTVNQTELSAIKNATKDGKYDLTFTVQNSSGDSVSRTITVFVLGEDDVDQNGIVLFTDNFNVNLADAPTYSNAVVDSNAVAYNKETGEQLDTANISADHTNINAATEVGPVNVAVTYSDGNTAVTTVVASIIDEHTVIGEDYAIKAENIVSYLPNNDGKSPLSKDLTSTNVLDYAKVVAWDVKTGADVKSNVEVDATQLDAIQNATEHGVYDLTFTVGSAQKVVKVFVLGDKDVLENGIVLFAENFNVNLADAPTYSNAVVDSKAIAYNEASGEELDVAKISADHTNINAATEVGPVDVAITYTDGDKTATTVIASVIDEDTVVGTDYAIKAENFTVYLPNVSGKTPLSKDLTSATALDYAKVIAWNINTGADEKSNVEVDATQLDAIVNATEHGVYDLTFRVGSEEKVVKVFVLDEDDVEANGMKLFTESFKVELSKAASYTSEEGVVASKAVAYDAKTGLEMSGGSYSADVSNINSATEVGPVDVEVTYTSAEGKVISGKVIASIVDGTVVGDRYLLTAVDFEMTLTEAQSLDTQEKRDEALLAGSKAKAWDSETGASATAKVTSTTFEAKLGTYPVTIVVDEDQNVTKTIYVTVKNGNVVTEGDVSLSAENFTVNLKDKGDSLPLASSLTEESAKDLAKVYAWNNKDGSDLTSTVTVNATQLAAIQNATEHGVYDLTFTVTQGDDTANNTIKVFVLGDKDVLENGIVLFAENFNVNLADAPTYSNAVVDSKAIAYNEASGEELDVAKISADHTNINAATEVGPVDVAITYTDGDKAATTVIASVIDENTVIGEDHAIKAENFKVYLPNVSGNTPLSKDLTSATALDYAKVIAWNINTGADEKSNVEVDATQLDAIVNATEHGVYDLTFRVGSEEKVVKVFVLDEDDVEKDDYVLFAENFNVNLADAPTYSNGLVDSKAKAYNYKTGVELNSDNITVDHANINAATEVGPVPVSIVYSDSNVVIEAVKIASIIDDTVIIVDNEAVSASNFVLSITEASKLTDDTVKSKANAKAWNIKTGDSIELTADYSKVEAKEGVYNVSFSTAKGATKTVKAIVLSNPVVGNNEAISANDFILTIDEAKALNDEKAIKAAKAVAYNTVTAKEISINADYSKVEAKPGSYDVTFTTDNGLSITVRATVGNNLVIVDGKAIAANSIVIEKSVVKEFENDREALNEYMVKESGARAWVIADNSELTPVVANSDAIDLANIKPDTYFITYTHELNTRAAQSTLSTEAGATVKGKNTVVEPDNDEAIDANDFAIAAQEVSSLTDAKVIKLAEARAWKLSTGENVEIVSVDFSKVLAKQGVYDVVFTTKNGTSTTIQAFVGKNRPPVIIEEKGIVIFANDYTVNESELDSLTLSDHVKLSEAQIIDQDTYEKIEIGHIDVARVLKQSGVYPAQFGIDKDNHVVVEVTVVADEHSKTGFEIPVSLFSMVMTIILGLFIRRKIRH